LDIQTYKQRILQKQIDIKNQIERDFLDLSVDHQYIQVFNGLSVEGISDFEAKRLESLPNVKKVYPNYKVHTTLMDSVPLIQGGIFAGNLDDQGASTDIVSEDLDGDGDNELIVGT